MCIGEERLLDDSIPLPTCAAARSYEFRMPSMFELVYFN